MKALCVFVALLLVWGGEVAMSPNNPTDRGLLPPSQRTFEAIIVEEKTKPASLVVAKFLSYSFCFPVDVIPVTEKYIARIFFEFENAVDSFIVSYNFLNNPSPLTYSSPEMANTLSFPLHEIDGTYMNGWAEHAFSSSISGRIISSSSRLLKVSLIATALWEDTPASFSDCSAIIPVSPLPQPIPDDPASPPLIPDDPVPLPSDPSEPSPSNPEPYPDGPSEPVTPPPIPNNPPTDGPFVPDHHFHGNHDHNGHGMDHDKDHGHGMDHGKEHGMDHGKGHGNGMEHGKDHDNGMDHGMDHGKHHGKEHGKGHWEGEGEGEGEGKHKHEKEHGKGHGKGHHEQNPTDFSKNHPTDASSYPKRFGGLRHRTILYISSTIFLCLFIILLSCCCSRSRRQHHALSQEDGQHLLIQDEEQLLDMVQQQSLAEFVVEQHRRDFENGKFHPAPTPSAPTLIDECSKISTMSPEVYSQYLETAKN